MDRQWKRYINRLRRWIFLRKLIDWLFVCVPAGVFAAGICELAAYFVPWYSVHYWAAALVLLGVIAAFIISLVKYPSGKEAAAALDGTGLKERTQTAWELMGTDGLFAELQKKDAWENVSAVHYTKRLPVRIAWQRPAVLAALCALLVTAVVLPSPAKEDAKKLHLAVEKAKKEIEKVEKAKKELEKDSGGDAKLDEYRDLLTDITKELQDVKAEESLDKAVGRAQKKLEQMAEKTDDAARKETLQQLAQSLEGASGSKNSSQKDGTDGQNAGKQNAEQQQAAAEKAQELLEKLQQELKDKGSLGELGEDELKEAAQALEQLGELSGQELSAGQLQELSELSDQISSGSVSSSALESAQATVGSIKSTATAKLEGQQGSSASKETQNPNGNGAGSGDGDGNGNGDGSGNGDGNGQGSGMKGGQGGGKGTGGGWNYGSNKGTERETSYDGEMVSVPKETGDDDNLTGKNQEGTNYSVNGGSLAWSGNQVQYDQVIGEYQDQAMTDIENSDYPSGVQGIIKSYFEELN